MEGASRVERNKQSALYDLIYQFLGQMIMRSGSLRSLTAINPSQTFTILQ